MFRRITRYAKPVINLTFFRRSLLRPLIFYNHSGINSSLQLRSTEGDEWEHHGIIKEMYVHAYLVF